MPVGMEMSQKEKNKWQEWETTESICKLLKLWLTTQSWTHGKLLAGKTELQFAKYTKGQSSQFEHN
jgi:hypothetical protein